MHDARAISNFFIARSIDFGPPITALSLLKVLYFSHAWYLAKHKKALVAQPFEAWEYGPVNRIVYDQIKRKSKDFITKKLLVFDPIDGVFAEAMPKIDLDTEKFLSQMFDYYTKFSAVKLSDLTHEAGSPWDLVWRKAEFESVPGMIIPNDLILEWFGRRSDRLSRGH